MIDPKKKNSVAIVQKVTLLSAEKSKSMEIVLGRLRLPPKLICRALLTCDMEILKPTVLESLNGICPHDEDVKIVASYDGDKSLLATPEIFVDEIRFVNGFQHRIKAMVFLN